MSLDFLGRFRTSITVSALSKIQSSSSRPCINGDAALAPPLTDATCDPILMGWLFNGTSSDFTPLVLFCVATISPSI